MWQRDAWVAAAGLAAGILLGFLVAPVSREPEITPLHSVPRVLVQGALRGADSESELVLPPGADHALVDAAFELPEGTDPATALRFEIRDAAGHPTWTATEPASSVAALLARHELVGFLVPAGALTDGEHRFEISSGGATLLSARFRVRRG